MSDEAWRYSALCGQIDPDLWFPPPGGTGSTAKQICKRCPVIAECFEFAVSNGETEGVWAGLSGRQLRDAVRARRASPEPADERYEVVKRLSDAGWTAAVIAAELGVHERTVHRIRAKGEAA